MRLLLPLLLAACPGTRTEQIGDFQVTIDRRTGTFDVSHAIYGEVLEDVRLSAGTGAAEIEMRFGSFRFTDEVSTMHEAGRVGKQWNRQTALVVIDLEDGDGALLGTVVMGATSQGDLVLDWSAEDPGANRLALSAACEEDDHFLGLGSHAMDVDHVGEAFALWTSEPGIGKVEGEVPADDWYLTGTRHATSFPVPFLLRPQRATGLLVDTPGRVTVDLCASDPGRFRVTAEAPRATRFVVFRGEDARGTVSALTGFTGRPELPPEWVFAPWNDAIRGPDRVREVATTLREAGAPSSVIWTEDWKGAEETAYGYHLTPEWFVDESLYPDASTLADELEADGFKWFAYFAPFLVEGTETFDDAVANDVVIRDELGEVYTFLGVSFEETTLVDLSTEAGRAWAQGYMQGALDLGFDGWMADYAEWLPHDAVLADGTMGLLVHNTYPEHWQQTNAELLEEEDASFFVRSGWSRTGGLVPVVWAGDQRTSFDTDDGFPTVLPLGLGLSASGVPIYTHDVAGYQSLGNDPSDRELWWRWASLGAYTPILRTHHGAYDQENWQFDSDEETLAHWVEVAREHVRLFPYRYGLADRASDEGIPMIEPVAFRFADATWDRTDAWMLGDALLVAPVLERGVTGREVDLPDDVAWFDWHTRARVETGWFDAPVGAIPVFAAEGTIVPTFATIPDTLFETDGLVDLADADAERVVYVFGTGGRFSEADGTTYAASGTPTGDAETTVTITADEVEVGGLTVAISGDVERTYTVVVVAP